MTSPAWRRARTADDGTVEYGCAACEFWDRDSTIVSNHYACEHIPGYVTEGTR